MNNVLNGNGKLMSPLTTPNLAGAFPLSWYALRIDIFMKIVLIPTMIPNSSNAKSVAARYVLLVVTCMGAGGESLDFLGSCAIY
jgi:hypothetical protein